MTSTRYLHEPHINQHDVIDCPNECPPSTHLSLGACPTKQNTASPEPTAGPLLQRSGDLHDHWAVVRRAVYLAPDFTHPHPLLHPFAHDDCAARPKSRQPCTLALRPRAPRNKEGRGGKVREPHAHMSSLHPIPFSRQLNRYEKYV